MAEPAPHIWNAGAPSNASYRHAAHPHLKPEVVTVYRPHQTWTYNNHPFLTHWDGQFYAMWSNGLRDEDDIGQRVLVATSADGKEWSAPRVLAEPLGRRTLTAGGFMPTKYGLAGLYSDYDDDVADTHLYAKVTPDGHKWSRATSLGLAMCSNQNPLQLSNGRRILAGNFAMPFSDDPDGLAGWRWSSIAPEFPHEDNPWTFWQVRRSTHQAADLCEVSLVEDGGALHAFFRATGADYNGHLWHALSTDFGTTWSRPEPIDFSDNDAKFQVGRLDAERCFYCGCPDLNSGKRNPLVFSIAKKDLHFDRHWIIGDTIHRINWPGKHKSGDYSYPSVLVHESRVYVIVARQKEDIEILSFNASDLS